MVISAIVCLFIVDGHATLEKGGGITIGSGPVSGFYMLVALMLVIIRRFRLRRQLQVWRQAINGKKQFLCFDDTGIHYGYEQIQENFLAWNAISSAILTRKTLELQLAGRVMSVTLADFNPEERSTLLAFLESRKLLKKA